MSILIKKYLFVSILFKQLNIQTNKYIDLFEYYFNYLQQSNNVLFECFSLLILIASFESLSAILFSSLGI